MSTIPVEEPVGGLLRRWRRRRNMSQLSLALGARISARHLSFLETGRSVPSREMLLRLAEHLDVPPRERNSLLLAAGYAPAFRERPLHDPALAAARGAVEMLLAAHEPFPALAVDRHWNLLAHNRAVTPFLAATTPALLAPPVNVLRLSLHPGGLAPRIENLGEWRAHVLARLRRQVDVSLDPVLADLLRELEGYPMPETAPAASPLPGDPHAGVIVTLRLSSPRGPLTFVSTTTVFGTPVDITLSELALETFFPGDEATASVLREIARDCATTPRD